MPTVSSIMTRDVRVLAPTDSLRRAAQLMEELNVGVIPVCNGKKLVGMVTDRDITLRGVAKGLGVEDTPLSVIMTEEVLWCFEDQPVSEVMEKMGDAQVRRLPVVDREKHLVGILSLGDIAAKADGKSVGAVLQDISETSSPERTSTPAASQSGG
ncbi:MAG TPA: CBS domain-containing protein [Polaromonas sp.]|uniref:CBS domain-containing protein n=1 Tax=Polaromonas sp. TaxID=1869339 RepID=UPI002D4A16EA|nr:CBS domain-containing protein [Polaromonas sp.]HYW56111.1 CBS domain-containing protein [Polaromonas sp.]